MTLGTFGKLLIAFSTKVNLLYLLLYSTTSASDKAKVFDKNFSKNCNLDDSGIALPDFPSRTNLKLHNTSVILKMIKTVTKNFGSSKEFGLDYIPVVVLKNCDPEI